MATKAQCIEAAMAGGLSRGEAETVVDTLLQERARVKADLAQGKIADAERELAEAWRGRMGEARVQNAQARRQAAINVLTRQTLNARMEAVKAAGFSGMDALEATLVGSNKRFFGARDSIESRRISIKRDFLGGMINELEAMDAQGTPLKKLFAQDAEFNANVVREVILPESTGDAAARAVADIFSRHMEKARLRLNAAGADIGRLEGYLPQSHDLWKITGKRKDGRDGRQAWIEALSDKLDMEKTFPGLTDPKEIAGILDHIYDNITLGRENGPNALERGERSGPANMAARLGAHRVLHFKDADAFMAYHAEYGRGNVLSGVISHLEGASRKLALMEVLGPNPEAMLKSVIAEEIRLTREAEAGKSRTPEQEQAFRDLQNAEGLKSGKVAYWFMELTGEAGWVANNSAARFMSVLRATQTLSKLGGASLSAVADAFIKAMNMRNVAGLSWPEAVAESIGQYFKLYRGEERQLARQLGAFVEDMSGEMRVRWDVNDAIPGRLASLQDKLFRWSGLNWITETGKAGYAMWFSRHLGEAAEKAWGELDASRLALLQYHGFDAGKWDLLRLMAEETPDGQRLIVPARADLIPDAALENLLPELLRAEKNPAAVLDAWTQRQAATLADLREKFPFERDSGDFTLGSRSEYEQFLWRELPEELRKKPAAMEQAAWEAARSRELDRARRDLRTDALSMITDETMYAIIEPDARARAFMRQGTRPGTVAGEFWRTIMQFKSFPITYLQREMGGRRWVRGDLQEGMRYGWNRGAIRDAVSYDPRGVIGAAVSAYLFGYLAMTLKDLAKGRTPRDPTEKETVFAALMQSGGAGILGDFFFNKANRYGGSFAGTLTGPLTGEVGRAITAMQSMMRGEFQDGGEDALRILMDNAPLVNLWYTREALNWGLLYHLREMISPGTLARTERKLKEEYGQGYVFSPARGIKRGGGFR
jgi:hypothetical protein